MNTAVWLTELTITVNRGAEENVSEYEMQRALWAFSRMQHGKGRRILGEDTFKRLQEVFARGLDPTA